MYCELLNEQISAERYRTAGAGCGRGDNTPYIRDTALLSFRHSFALNVQVKNASDIVLLISVVPPAEHVCFWVVCLRV